MALGGTGMSSCRYELRLESIGGLGAHLAGQMLAEAGVLEMGLSGAQFSSYGSEKKGSPVKSYVRLGPPGRKLRTTGPVREPDLVAVFHQALLRDPGVTAGLRPGATLIVNSERAPAAVAAELSLSGVRVLTVNATDIAVAEKTRVNTAILGTVAAATPVLAPQAVRTVIARTLGQKYPQLVAANLRTFDRGYCEWREHTAALVPDQTGTTGAAAPVARAARAAAATTPAVGYRSAPIGGILPTAGSTVHKDVSASRQGFLPVFQPEACVHCAICDLLCPDFCFVWAPTGETVAGYPAQRLMGIDYQYCKGCMLCVQECPTGALTREREASGMAEQLTVRQERW